MNEGQQPIIKKGTQKDMAHHVDHIPKRIYKTVTGTAIGIALLVSIVSYYVVQSYKQKDRDRNFAAYIVDEFDANNIPVNYNTIYQIIRQGQPIVKKYFSKRQFNIKDVLAIGYVESCYHCDVVGSCGEVGLFQILDPDTSLSRMAHVSSDSIKGNKEYDFYDIAMNVEMCCDMLNEKLIWKKNYKHAIIAYNGSETYWQKFIRIKKIIDKASYRLNSNATL